MAKNLKFAFAFIFAIWIVFILDLIIPLRFTDFGILPRTTNGLIGIPLSPFLHSGIFHIASNSIPLFILLFLLFTFYKKESFQTVTIIILLGGALVWLFGRNSYHIGASGLIYGLVAFLIASGIFRKNLVSIIISLVIFLLYGGLIYGLFPTRSYISWEGHLFGALSGVFCGYIYGKPRMRQNREKN